MLPAVARWRMLAGGANSSTARVGTLVPESCPHLQTPRHVNLFHLLAVIPLQAGCSAEPQHAALASGCLIPRCEGMLHLLFLVICLGCGIQALKQYCLTCSVVLLQNFSLDCAGRGPFAWRLL